MLRLTCSITAFLMLLAFVNCSTNTPEPLITHEGTIVWGGNPSKEGCGWLIRINDSVYKPTEIPAGFEVENLPINLSYKKLNSKFTCSWSLGISYIEVNEITIRN